jgi:hypothetical protein
MALDVVLSHRRAEQRGRASADQQTVMRQVPGVVVEQAIGLAQDVAVGVGHQEGVAVLQGIEP